MSFEDDPVTRELRDSLQRHATEAPRGEFLAERIIAAADQAGAAARRRSPRRWALPLIAAGAVAAAAALAFVGVQALQPQPKHHQQPLSTGSVHPTPRPTTTAPTQPAPPRHTDLNQVQILDVTFAYKHAWAISSAACVGDATRRCTALLKSDDGGRNWPSVPAANLFPVPGVSDGCGSGCVTNLRFVNHSTGYAFGPRALWMTNDGGVSWTHLPGGADALESLDEDVIRASRTTAGQVQVRVAANGSRHWTQVPFADTADRVALNRGHGASYLLLLRNGGPSTVYRSEDTGHSWTSLGEPCPTGRSLAVAAGVNGGVSVLCKAPDDSRYVATSTDFGAHFAAGDPVPTSADLLAGDPSTVLLAGGDGLSRSTSGGRGWTQIAQVTGTLGFVGTESETKATAVSADGRTIWTTRDGGRHWTAVSLG